MINQALIDYQRIERAINYIGDNFKDQPSLDDIAKKINLSPYHFQRLFSRWAGVSPKKYMQYVSLTYAKEVLLKKNQPLMTLAYDMGLSGTSRLHDLFINIEGMTPGQFKNCGDGLNINYSYSDTLFGNIIVASTSVGVCHVAFENCINVGIENLKKKFPKAKFFKRTDKLQKDALKVISQEKLGDFGGVKVHLLGTPFQLKVWEALLKIPMGCLTTYGDIADIIGKPNASRAVGTAIGRNPIALLIPCHRVIQKSGQIGGYMWGENRKRAIIAWEGLKTDEEVK